MAASCTTLKTAVLAPILEARSSTQELQIPVISSVRASRSEGPASTSPKETPIPLPAYCPKSLLGGHPLLDLFFGRHLKKATELSIQLPRRPLFSRTASEARLLCFA